ncbi:MAG: glutamate-cysteine ligase family protein [Defluviitaleaceae bacterium]|nr:glutamate-cysteine ligase family protein [Defluviitaleaceae bacterium]
MSQKNINALAEYFALGCKNENFLGLELEHFVVDTNGYSVSYNGGVAELLTKLAKTYGTPVFSTANGFDQQIIGIKREKAEITIEPAAQLEISIGPCLKTAEIYNIYNEFTATITPILTEMGFSLVCANYHPKSKVDDLPLIPKNRYNLMYNHFATVGTCGKHMMKGSAATQLTIDYKNENDFVQKFRIANVLGPLLAFLFDTTTTFEGEPSFTKMLRTHIWNNVDPARSMVAKNALNIPRFGFHEYAEYVYNTPPIFIIADGTEVYTGNKTAAEIFADKTMSTEDILHVISMVFPDVRLKTNIEIRMVDSLPIATAIKYAKLIKNIFYNEPKLAELHSLTAKVTNADVAAAKANLMQHGTAAEVYGKPAKYWLNEFLGGTKP